MAVTPADPGGGAARKLSQPCPQGARVSGRTRLPQTGAQQGEGCSQGHVRLPRHQKPQTGRANDTEKLRTSQLRTAAPRGRRQSRSPASWSRRAEVAAERDVPPRPARAVGPAAAAAVAAAAPGGRRAAEPGR